MEQDKNILPRGKDLYKVVVKDARQMGADVTRILCLVLAKRKRLPLTPSAQCGRFRSHG